ncbi:MAG: PEGA domain-containing protein, partial [Polyangiaceae bacterium]|nr:PEGA domain-containing protein [Polyangiaceae bacterium]
MGFIGGAVLVLALVLGTASRAMADGEADQAELEFQLGADRYREGAYREALLHFLSSNRLARNRNVMFNVARTYERIGRFPEAYRWYVDAAEGETDASVRASIDEALARITPRVSVLDVVTTPAGATLYLNRMDLGSIARSPRRIALEPGTYRVIAALEGYEE